MVAFRNAGSQVSFTHACELDPSNHPLSGKSLLRIDYKLSEDVNNGLWECQLADERR
jgi:hypothetical protein